VTRPMTTVVAALLAAAPASGQDLEQQVDSLFSWTSPDAPGCVVAAAKDGRTVIERAYGLADVEGKVRLTANSVFDIGSVQKQFIAAAVLQLVEDGRVALTDDIGKYFPELPDYGHIITVDHILTHTSGIRDWLALLQFSSTDEDALALLLRQRGLNFRPGEAWAYSNGNYLLAKVLVERVSGQSFNDFAQARMFGPLGMTSTMYARDVRAAENHAKAYVPDGNGWREGMMLGEERGPGALLTTVGDLLRWNAALSEGRLGAYVTEKLQEPARLSNGRTLQYGRALFLDENAGGRVIWHSGSAQGYGAFLARFPEQKLSIATLCNGGDGTRTDPRGIYELLAPEAASLDRPDAPSAAAPAGVEVSGRAGLYFDEAGRSVRLTTNAGRLGIAGGGSLVPMAGGGFRSSEPSLSFRSGDEFELRFIGADRFEIVSMEGEVTHYRRAEPWSPTDAELESLVGRYESADLAAAFDVVSSEQGVRVRLNGGEQVVPVSPIARDVFQVAQMFFRFLRDDSGRVVGIEYSNPVLQRVRFARVGGS
jgi:CubicO group peptidase (beta-lactamase class C family)